MANTRSDIITNLLAGTKNPVGADGSRERYRRCEFPTLAAEAANHLYPLFRVSAFDRILTLNVSNTADAGMTDLNLGAYVAGDWTVADQALVAGTIEDRLVDGANRAAATTQPVNIWGTGTNSFAENLQGLPLWQVLGLSTAPAPGTQYDLVLKAAGASNPAGGGVYVFEMDYVAGD